MTYDNFAKKKGFIGRWLTHRKARERNRVLSGFSFLRGRISPAVIPARYPFWMEVRPYTGTAPKVWRLVDGWFGDYSEKFEPSDGTTNQRVIAFAAGRAAYGATAWYRDDWGNDKELALTTDGVSPNAVATFILGSGNCYNVNRDPNPVHVRLMMGKWQGVDYPSDEVWGVCLPSCQHTQTWAVFELKDNGETPPPPPSGDFATVEQVKFLINQALEKGKF